MLRERFLGYCLIIVLIAGSAFLARAVVDFIVIVIVIAGSAFPARAVVVIVVVIVRGPSSSFFPAFRLHLDDAHYQVSDSAEEKQQTHY